jgi:GAF domain-containing protein
MWPDFLPASAIGAPIFGPAGLSGVLTGQSSTPRRFSSSDGHFLQGIANVVGTALLN